MPPVSRFGISLGLVLLIMAPVVAILGIIGRWKVFTKAGEKGWKSIVPFYNVCTMLKMSGRDKYIRIYIAGIIMRILAFLLMLFSTGTLFGITLSGVWQDLELLSKISWIFPLTSLVMYVLIGVSAFCQFGAIMNAYSGICQNLGLGVGMTVGLFFLSPIFWILLGFNQRIQWTGHEVCAAFEDDNA